jgi:hypothetical protein
MAAGQGSVRDMAAAMVDKGHNGAACNGALGQRKANIHRRCGLVKGHEHEPSPIGGTVAAAYVFWSI